MLLLVPKLALMYRADTKTPERQVEERVQQFGSLRCG